MKDLISIIIRTKNEERWIAQCLREVFGQDYRNFEVIIVDNMSIDKTIEKARQFKVKKILSCSEYLPGKALNVGIKESSGRYIACLSGHCIPINGQWLENLARNFQEKDVAGVYGRQEPISSTSDADKRDLALIFGLDRKVQVKDSFFHNANSMILRDVWEKAPFDEKLTNIEDRAWAKKVLDRRYKIIYEPSAGVYHHHGIHQNGDAERCTNVVRIMGHIYPDYGKASLDAEKLNILALIPVKGAIQYIDKKPLIFYTIQRALESKYIKKTIVSTDNRELAGIAGSFGAEVPFLREPSLSEEHINLASVYQYSLRKIEENSVLPDLVVCLEATFPFRPKGLLDDMILKLVQNGFDSVIAAKRENKGIWKEIEGKIMEIDEGLTPRQFKDPTFIELRGVGCVTHPEFLRDGKLLGKKSGIYEINNTYSHIEVRSEEDFKMASLLVTRYFG